MELLKSFGVVFKDLGLTIGLMGVGGFRILLELGFKGLDKLFELIAGELQKDNDEYEAEYRRQQIRVIK